MAKIFADPEKAMLGLLSALTTTHEVMIAKGITSPQELARVFEALRGQFEKRGNADAAGVMSMVLRPLVDPSRRTARKPTQAPPEGSS